MLVIKNFKKKMMSNKKLNHSIPNGQNMVVLLWRAKQKEQLSG
jgi:hypothetical protein